MLLRTILPLYKASKRRREETDGPAQPVTPPGYCPSFAPAVEDTDILRRPTPQSSCARPTPSSVHSGVGPGDVD
ncbi:hypothetical protein GSI_13621 [Ganoderma sinense ZZ0214-1]|uniref:Uncharacterized protein n=1 Tax=Ganoderma sinense ZZ0214-1 TaxID=1077348 RepID=A0A2G8RQT0_9APHY|nr:hypothetical protein GSI_13621 [Ganoderma sinense ZZ0214-1]